jgi:short-chain fatty acids transporter
MKRYKCTVSDKRGVMGDCMEEHKEGRWVPASVALHQQEVIGQLRKQLNPQKPQDEMKNYFVMDGRAAFDFERAVCIESFQAVHDCLILGFAMQIILIIITGFSIALSPLVKRGIDSLSYYIKTPAQVYFLVVFIGMLLSLISFGWVVITCVLARELALRVKGINYPFLIACVYFSFNSWVLGLSSSIPLLLNSENNFLIEAEILTSVIPTSYTLQSSLNVAMIALFAIGAPLLMLLLRPKSAKNKELSDLMVTTELSELKTIKEEASSLKLPFKSLSDTLNNSFILQMLIVIMGLIYIVFHFSTKGFDLNFNIMIFIFIIIGLFLHKTPSRYVISMKRSSSNVSGILFQYPFYAGIMGIMLYTGLGDKLGQVLASVATLDSYPFYAYLTGGIVNFAIPSAGVFAIVFS